MEDILEKVREYELRKNKLLAGREQIVGMLSFHMIEETRKLTIADAKKHIREVFESHPFLQEFEKEALANFEEYISHKKIAE